MKPHLFLCDGQWHVCREGRGTMDWTRSISRPSFPEACHLAMLAAIHAGVWRA